MTSDSKFRVRGQRNYDFLRQLPEKKIEQGYATYIVPATDTNVELLDAHSDEIEFEDELSETIFQKTLLTISMTEKIREQTAIFKDTGVLPHAATLLDDRLSPYQKIAAYNASLMDGYGLFMEQGTGKTFTSIVRAAKLIPGAKIIVVCPNNVRMNWQKELEKFCDFELNINIMRGWQGDRINALVETFKKSSTAMLNVAIIGYGSIQGSWPALRMVRWDLAIADESHMFKDSLTKRWKYMKKLRDTADRRLVLTGSPIANTINDLWSQFEFMGEGYSGFSSYNAFKRFFGIYNRDQDGTYERFLDLQNVPVIKDRLSRYSFQITKAEALPDLPEKVYDIDEVEMSEEQERAYNSLARELSIVLENEMNDAENEALVVNNILTQLLKLAQITSGFVTFPAVIGPDGSVEQEARRIEFSPNPKIERLIEILQSKSRTEKTIVWACFQHDIQKIKTACDVHGIDAVTYYGATKYDERLEAERRFNCDVNCKVLIGNPAAGGTGLNLLGYPPGEPDLVDTNADHVIYYSQDWSSLKRAQSEDRAHRRGTRTNIRVTDLCIPGTIDEQIRERVVEKRLAAFEITDLRALLKEIALRA